MTRSVVANGLFMMARNTNWDTYIKYFCYIIYYLFIIIVDLFYLFIIIVGFLLEYW